MQNKFNTIIVLFFLYIGSGYLTAAEEYTLEWEEAAQEVPLLDLELGETFQRSNTSWKKVLKTANHFAKKIGKKTSVQKTQSSSSSSSSSSSAVATNVGSCGICLEQGVRIALQCGHSYCRACLNDLVNVAMKDKSTAGLRCPEPQCREILGQTDIIKIINNDRGKIENLAALATKDWLAQQPGRRQCPTPDCSYKFINDEGNKQTIECPQCHHEYCSDCLVRHAAGVRCQQAQSQVTSSEEQVNKKWIAQNTKPCPRCSKPIEKDAGCLHMQCPAPCGGPGKPYDFCWACLGPYERPRHGPYKCPENPGAYQRERVAIMTERLQQAGEKRNAAWVVAHASLAGLAAQRDLENAEQGVVAAKASLAEAKQAQDREEQERTAREAGPNIDEREGLIVRLARERAATENAYEQARVAAQERAAEQEIVAEQARAAAQERVVAQERVAEHERELEELERAQEREQSSKTGIRIGGIGAAFIFFLFTGTMIYNDAQDYARARCTALLEPVISAQANSTTWPIISMPKNDTASKLPVGTLVTAASYNAYKKCVEINNRPAHCPYGLDYYNMSLIKSAIENSLTQVQQNVECANINAQDGDGKTALMWAADNDGKEWEVGDYYDSKSIIQYLISAGANLNLHDNVGRTALIISTKHDLKDVQYFVNSGADLNAQDSDGKTALMHAVNRMDLKIVRSLVDAKADLNIQDKRGLTALMWATYESSKPLVQYLVDAGAKVDVRDENGITARMIAAVESKKRFIDKNPLQTQKEADDLVKVLDAGSQPHNVTFSNISQSKKLLR